MTTKDACEDHFDCRGPGHPEHIEYYLKSASDDELIEALSKCCGSRASEIMSCFCMRWWTELYLRGWRRCVHK